MLQLTVNITPGQSTEGQCLSVPDMTTALIVAQLNADHGLTEIRSGERVLATLEKRGHGIAPFWHVY